MLPHLPITLCRLMLFRFGSSAVRMEPLLTSRNLPFDCSNDICVVPNHCVRFRGIVTVSENGQVKWHGLVAEIRSRMLPHIEPLLNSVQYLRNVFSIQRQSTFLRHRQTFRQEILEKSEVGNERLVAPFWQRIPSMKI
jgi:hypothetical protein